VRRVRFQKNLRAIFPENGFRDALRRSRPRSTSNSSSSRSASPSASRDHLVGNGSRAKPRPWRQSRHGPIWAPRNTGHRCQVNATAEPGRRRRCGRRPPATHQGRRRRSTQSSRPGSTGTPTNTRTLAIPTRSSLSPRRKLGKRANSRCRLEPKTVLFDSQRLSAISRHNFDPKG
jgi:hypothetical protein